MANQPLSKLAGMLCGNPRFQAFIGATCAESAAAFVRRQCGVASRRELDLNKQAAQRFHELRRRFAYGESHA